MTPAEAEGYTAARITWEYEIWRHPETGARAILCKRCGLTSHNPNDVEQRYCGGCHRFHEDPMNGGPE